MAKKSNTHELAVWQRKVGAQANNRAWRLSELTTRSPEEDEEMLQAAHASNYLWKIVGNAGNRAHAAQVLAHVYALLNSPDAANHYFAQAETFFLERDCEPWEEACAYAVKANVAAAAGQSEVHASSYREAERRIAALPHPEERKILNATLRVVPKPGEA